MHHSGFSVTLASYHCWLLILIWHNFRSNPSFLVTRSLCVTVALTESGNSQQSYVTRRLQWVVTCWFLQLFHSLLVRRLKDFPGCISLVMVHTKAACSAFHPPTHVQLVLNLVSMNCRAVRKALSFSLTRIQTHTLTVVKLWLSSHYFPNNLAIIP